MGAAKLCTQFVGKLRKVPAETLAVLFSANLLASKRKEEKRMKVAAQLLDTGRELVVSDGAPSGPYGDSSGIVLPQVSARALQGLRRKGVTPKKDYNSVRAQVVPTYTISRFIEDLKQSRQSGTKQ